MNADHTAGLIIYAEGDAESSAVVLLIESTCLYAVGGGSEVCKAAYVLANKLVVKVNVVSAGNHKFILRAVVGSAIRIRNSICNNRLGNSVEVNRAGSVALVVKVVKSCRTYSLFKLNCHYGCTCAILDIIGNVEVVYAVAGNNNFTELFTYNTIGYTVYTYGVSSIVGNCKAKGDIVCGGVILLRKVEEESIVYVVKSRIGSRGSIGGGKVTEIHLNALVLTVIAKETVEADAESDIGSGRGAVSSCSKHFLSYNKLISVSLPLGGNVCLGGNKLPTVAPNVIAVAVLVEGEFYPTFLRCLSLKAEGDGLSDVLFICPNLIEDGETNVLVVIYATCSTDSAKVDNQTVACALESVELIGTLIESITCSCYREASVNAIVTCDLSCRKSNGECALCHAVGGAEGMSNRFLKELAILCHDIVGNNNGVISSVLDIIRYELPLLVTVRAVPITGQFTSGRKAVDLNLLNFTCTDGAGELKLNRGILGNFIYVVDRNVSGNADILGSINVNDDTLRAVILKPVVSIAVESTVDVDAVIFVKTVTEVVCDSGCNKTEERNVEVTCKISGSCVVGIVRTFKTAGLSTNAEDGSTALYQGVGSTAAVCKYEVKSGVNGLTVVVGKNGLFFGHSDAIVGGSTVFNVRIHVGIVLEICLKTGLTHMSLVVTKLCKFFGSGVSKTYYYTTLGVTVSTNLFRVNRRVYLAVALDVESIDTDLTKGTKERGIGMDAVVVRKRVSTVVTGYGVKLTIAAEISVMVVTAHGNKSVVGNYANVTVEERAVKVRTGLTCPAGGTGVVGGHSDHNGKLSVIIGGIKNIHIKVEVYHGTVGLNTVGNLFYDGVTYVGVLILFLLLGREGLKLSLRNTALSVSGLEPGRVIYVLGIGSRLIGNSIGKLKFGKSVLIDPLNNGITLYGFEVVVPDLNDALKCTRYTVLIIREVGDVVSDIITCWENVGLCTDRIGACEFAIGVST